MQSEKVVIDLDSQNITGCSKEVNDYFANPLEDCKLVLAVKCGDVKEFRQSLLESDVVFPERLLTLACEFEQTEIASIILKQGLCNDTSRRTYDRSPLDFAAIRGMNEIIWLLIKSGVKVDSHTRELTRKLGPELSLKAMDAAPILLEFFDTIIAYEIYLYSY